MRPLSMPLPPRLPVASPQPRSSKSQSSQRVAAAISVCANATLFFATREFRLILSPKSTPFSRVRATPTSAKDAILPDSTSAIAFLTPSPRPPANRSFSKAKTSAKPTCNLPYHKQAGYKIALDLCCLFVKISVRHSCEISNAAVSLHFFIFCDCLSTPSGKSGVNLHQHVHPLILHYYGATQILLLSTLMNSLASVENK